MNQDNSGAVVSMHCDFCNKPILKGHDKLVIGKPVLLSMCFPGGHIDIDHTSHWAACGFCFNLIERGYWESLVARVLRSEHAVGDIPLEIIYRVTYSKAFGCSDLVDNFVSRNSPAVAGLLP